MKNVDIDSHSKKALHISLSIIKTNIEITVMIKLIENKERGRTIIDWLESYHSFSFGNFYDKQKINFGSLRVINEDFVKGGGGFPTHPHKNMEIITYVTSGALEHKDSTGTSSIIHAGDLQKMSAGKGILHSEFNHSKSETVHLFQIWITPNELEITPYYEQQTLSKEERINKFHLVASNERLPGKIFINQDVNIFLADVETTKSLRFELKPDRGLYLHLIKGNLKVNDIEMIDGDAITVLAERFLTLTAQSFSELILFDLPMNFNN